MTSAPAHDEPERPNGPRGHIWAIFLVSVLGLFLEMLLIRWVGTEIRIFAYLQNTILIACFLGLGLGCFTSRQPVRLRQSLIPLAILLVLMAIPFTRGALGFISELLSLLRDMDIWAPLGRTNQLASAFYVVLGLALTFLLLMLIVDIFVPIGRFLGRRMDEHPNTIQAYSVNIAGSLVGTWLFVLLSFLYQPPFTWFLLLAGMMAGLVLGTRRDRRVNIALLVVMVALSWSAGIVPGTTDVIWSPYQKLVVTPMQGEQSGGEYLLRVNNTDYQTMARMNEQYVADHPGRFPPELQGLSQYDIPFLLHPDPRSCILVGAGTGNDAAGALRHGVRHIVAVEIDPAIIGLGRRLHPDQPYASPAVTVVNTDARSFFATSKQKVDVIAFGLLDSHTTTSMTNARLDHYVYTRESIARARSLLADGGIMVLTFEAQKPYIADRMARVLQETFGEEPIAFRIPPTPYGWGGVMFIAGDLDGARRQIAGNPRLAAFIEHLQQTDPVPLPHTTKVAEDDWPYIYLESPRIPLLYVLLAGLMALLFLRSARHWKASDLAPRWHRVHWHFFFLGAAFLLLEVQNISKASVVFGNTWNTNAVIVSGVLVMALLGNWIAHRFPRAPSGPVYVALIGIAVALYFVDLAHFAFLPYAARVVVVGGLTTLPMLFSGIVFIRSFASVTARDEALGANMIGALTGALIQSMTFVVGIRALLIAVAALYVLAMLTRPGFAPAQPRTPLRPA